jgi:hypothetical protein
VERQLWRIRLLCYTFGRAERDHRLAVPAQYQEGSCLMHKRTCMVLLGVLVALALGLLGCSAPQSVAPTPTRTPRPTWTPAVQGLAVATPTLDPTKYPNVALPAAPATTPQVLVEGGEGVIFVPQAPDASGVQTVVVIIVTATPAPPPTPTPGPPTGTPLPTPTPGPPTPTPLPTATPLPPVLVEVVIDDANVRRGPGLAYPVVAKLALGTEITVVGRNRAGDWWQVCCVDGADVWVADSVVKVNGPLWAVQEVANIPAPPPPPPTAPPTWTPFPTPTFAWPYRIEGSVQEYPFGQDFFQVKGVIYNGVVPSYGYKLRVRKRSTGQEWLTAGSESYWNWEVIEYPDDDKPVDSNVDCPNPRTGLRCVKGNVKWDSNGVAVPRGDDVWEVTVTDGAGVPVSAPVTINTSATKPNWYYVVFTSRP